MAASVSVFESRLDEIARRCRELDVAEAELIDAVADYDRSGEWRTDGYVNAASALRDRCHLAPAAAGAVVRLGRKLRALPAVAEAFAAGAMSRAHAALIVNSYTPARAAELDTVLAVLVESAATMDVDDLKKVVKRATDAIDGDGGAADDAEIHNRRRLHSNPTMGGVVGNWFLDLEDGKIVKTAIEARMVTDEIPDDTRAPEQKRADALVAICRDSLGRDHPSSASERRRGLPHLSMIVDMREFDDNTDLFAAITADVKRGNGFSRATLERLACDCKINRIVTNGRSEILDLGRTTYIVPPHLYKALVARDEHCQHPGCRQPPEHCSPHHIWYWTRGGPTNLENLILLCWHHHRERHLAEARRHE